MTKDYRSDTGPSPELRAIEERMTTEQKHAPITDALERSIEASGKRDVPVRVYQQLRAFERDRDELAAALRKVAKLVPYGDGETELQSDDDDAQRVLNWHIANARAALERIKVHS